MKLLEIKCPNCSASLTVKGNKKDMICEYCGAKFLLDDESMLVKHIHAGEITEEQEFINAETYLNKLKNYEDAYYCYLSLVKRYVDNKELWLGLLRSYTHDFTNTYVTVSEYRKYWDNFKALSSKEEIKEYETLYQEYDAMIISSNKNEAGVFNNNSTESKYTELLITVFFGMFGIHKFIKGQIGMGLLYLFTGGLLYIGWICDIIKVVRKISSK